MSERHNYDLVYFDEVSDEVSHFIARVPPAERPPLVVRFNVNELNVGNLANWKPSGQIIDVCRKVSTIFVPNARSHQCLISLGITNTRIERFEDLDGVTYDRSIGARRNSRQVLSEINHDLFTKSTDQIIVCPAEMNGMWNLERLARAVAPLLENNRRLKLWILGDGPERSKLYKLLQHYGLHRVVAMPGIFTDLEHVLQVADLCVLPAAGVGLSWFAPTCALSNIPLILADNPEAATLTRDAHATTTFAHDSADDLRRKILDWLRNPAELTRSALDVQKFAVARQRASRDADRFLAIIDEHCVNS